MIESRIRPVIAMGALPVSAYIAVTLVAPAGVLVLYSFWEAGFFTVERTLTWDNYARVFEDSGYWRLILKSLLVGFVASLVAVPLAYVVAYAAIFRFKRAGNLLLALVMLSMLASYIVRIYAWKSILGPEGLVNNLLQSIHLVDRPLEFLLYGNFALVLTLVNILVPFAVLPIYSALQNVDRDTIAASRDLGSSGARTFRLVTLPLSMPGVSAALLFCFILASADYVTPQLVGGTNGLLVGRVISDQFGPAGNLPFGAALAVAMLVSLAVAILMLGVLGRALDLVGRRSTKTVRKRSGTSGLPGPLRAVASRVDLLKTLCIVILLFLYLPMLMVVATSFSPSPSGQLNLSGGLTLQWYRGVLDSSVFLDAVVNSALVAGATVVLALVLGTPAALALSRRTFVLQPLVKGLIVSPIALPGVVIGVAALSAVTLLGLDPGLWSVSVVHTLFTVPFVVLILRARLHELDWQLTEAARDLGSSRLRTFKTVTLPLMASAMAGAAILVFALSMDEFVITNFVVGTDTTLPVLIWSQMRRGVSPNVNAISSLILFGTLTLICIAALLLRARRRAAQQFAALNPSAIVSSAVN